METDIRQTENEPSPAYDRFGERLRNRTDVATGSRAPEKERGRFRTVVTVLWLVLVLPLAIGAIYTIWIGIGESGHAIAAARLRAMGVLVSTRSGVQTWPAREKFEVVDVSKEQWIVDFSHCKQPTDAELAYLPRLHRLVELYIQRCDHVTPDGLKVLTRLKDLEELHFGDYKSAGPEHVEAELEPLLHLRHLKTLDLSNFDSLSDRELSVVGRLTWLRELRVGSEVSYSDTIAHPHVTDAGIEHLGNLTQLRILSLAGTAVTDDGLARLQNFRVLENLDLGGTDISDAGLVNLKVMARLQTINLTGTRVTRAGLDALRQALPTAMITSDLEVETSEAEPLSIGESRYQAIDPETAKKQ
ncbi:MAG TPA: hypothetical protein VGZ22_14610 [Isosphaeraceae bacterium]|jgi:hypothetical protein|nr:hypothetical protein [Isosphaeraceae bacterium]